TVKFYTSRAISHGKASGLISGIPTPEGNRHAIRARGTLDPSRSAPPIRTGRTRWTRRARCTRRTLGPDWAGYTLGAGVARRAVGTGWPCYAWRTSRARRTRQTLRPDW